MEVIPKHPLIIITQDTVKKVRQLYGVGNVKRIKESLNLIEDWLKKQPHLARAAEYMNQEMLENLFIKSKGSVEGTKNNLERFLTCRGMMQEVFLHRSIDEFETNHNILWYVPLPKLHPVDQSRVMVTHFVSDDIEGFNLLTTVRYCFMIADYKSHYDYTPAERFIFDFKNIHAGLLRKLNPVVLKKAEVLCTEGFSIKVKGIHILNASTFLEKLIYILKRVLTEKVGSRIHAHNSYEDLYKHVPKEILPQEYGGDEESLQSLNGKWIKTLKGEEATRIIRDSDKLISDEVKRQDSKFNKEFMGMPGSFRTLTVD